MACGNQFIILSHNLTNCSSFFQHLITAFRLDNDNPFDFFYIIATLSVL